ncbi:hypothetical protein [Bacillus sp. NPDC094106]|uniref:hypothetical protein n=1 Tax=Bacillus sp. NPDC094106 TaxID=3363949 RepID=UPI00381A307E
MKIYHISLEDKRVEVFTPRVPAEEMRLAEEDSTTARFCVSTTIEGCLSAVPWGGSSLGLHDKKVITVYEFDTDDLQNKKNLITPLELYQKGFVPDAMYTNEHWIMNESIQPRNVFEIVIDSYEEKMVPDISYEDSLLLKERKVTLDEVWNGDFVMIKNIKYQFITKKNVA